MVGGGATEQGLVLCLEVTPKASHHIQLDKGIGEIALCVCVGGGGVVSVLVLATY